MTSALFSESVLFFSPPSHTLHLRQDRGLRHDSHVYAHTGYTRVPLSPRIPLFILRCSNSWTLTFNFQTNSRVTFHGRENMRETFLHQNVWSCVNIHEYANPKSKPHPPHTQQFNKLNILLTRKASLFTASFVTVTTTIL